MSEGARRLDRADRDRIERLLLILMATRLGLSMASLGIALLLEAIGGAITITEWNGFYGAVAASFVLTLLYRPFVGRIRRPQRFAAVNFATDIVLVSALVLFSGGSDSVFTFLYLAISVYGALLFRRWAALACGALAAAAYGAVLLLSEFAGVGSAPGVHSPGVLWMTWAVHAGALLVVSSLASFLAGELDQRTRDLAHLRTLHQRTVESLMSGLLTVDRDGHITSFNPEAERITGALAAEALGQDVEALVPGMRALLGGDGSDPRTRARLPYTDASGSHRYLGIGAYELRDAERTTGGKVVIFQDVTEVVQMERELRRSERLAAVGQLSASMAHEIRNPLASMSGSIQVMRSKLGEGEGETGRLMDIVLREVDRLDHLITDFLVFARPGPLHLGPVPLEELVADVLEMFEAVRPEEVEVCLDLAPGVCAHADAGQLRQLLWNLVLNASQAMATGGRLGIRAACAGEGATQEGDSTRRMGEDEKPRWAEIAVMDEGAGIPDDALERVFDPFFTTRRGGSGLGLATVHRIVDEHGGWVRIERAVEGWSTRIRVRLPLAEATG